MKRNFQTIKSNISEQTDSYLIWIVAFITLLIINSYITGPSWNIAQHGSKHGEKRVLMKNFFSTSHSQVTQQQRVIIAKFLPCLGEIGADGNWCDSNYLDPDDPNISAGEMPAGRTRLISIYGICYIITVFAMMLICLVFGFGPRRRKMK